MHLHHPRPRRRLPLTVVAAATAALTLAATLTVVAAPRLLAPEDDPVDASLREASSAATQHSDSTATTVEFVEPDVELPGEAGTLRSGEEAVTALGGQNGHAAREVARAYDITVAELVRRLRSDDSLHVDPSGRLLYADSFEDGHHAIPEETPTRGHAPDEQTHAEEPSTGAYATSGATDAWPTPVDHHFDPDEAFALHSRPESTKKLYLDFDGHVFGNDQAWGTRGFHCAWDPGFDGPGFSAFERRMVHETWLRVAAAFDAFDVDVTTEEPDSADLLRTSSTDLSYGARAVISGNLSIAKQPHAPQELCGGAGGSGTVGLAYVGTFGNVNNVYARTPALVAGSTTAASTAYIINHEFGHNFGLDHTFDRADDDSTDVSARHSRIMDYQGTSALNFFTVEDRTAITARTGTLPDGAGHDISTSRPATATQTGVLNHVVGSTPLAGEEDWYRLDDCSTFSARVTPGSTYTSVDLALSLRDADGTEIASHAPATAVGTTTSRLVGQDAALHVDLAGQGPHHLVVTTASPLEGGAGPGAAPVNGVHLQTHPHGTYRLEVAGCTGTSSLLAPQNLSSSTLADGTTTLSWAASPGTANVAALGVEVAVDGRRVVNLPAGSTTYSLSTTPDTAVRFRVRYRNGETTSPWAEARTTVPAGTPQLLRVVRDSSRAVLTLHEDPARPASSSQIFFKDASGQSWGYTLTSVPTTFTFSGTYVPPVGSTVTVRLFVDGVAGHTDHATTVLSGTTSTPAATLVPAEAPRGLGTEFRLPDDTSAPQPTLHLTWRTVPNTVEQPVTRYELTIGDTTQSFPAKARGTYSVQVSPGLSGVHQVGVRAVNANGAGPAAQLTLDIPALQRLSKPVDLELRESAGRTWLTWDRPAAVIAPGTNSVLAVDQWEIEVNGASTVVPGRATSLDLTGFRRERAVRVTLRGVSRTFGAGAPVSVTLAAADD